jgi:TatD DNase family protein
VISIVDTHCHIDLPAFDADRDDVVHDALASGVHAMIAIGFNPDRWETTSALRRDYPCIVRAVGIHPNDATIWSSITRQNLVIECEREPVVAIGEIGLDFYRSRADQNMQVRAFEEQLAVARDMQLPVIIHQREAEAAVLDVLRRFAPVHGVMHCFTGDDTFADACIALGLAIGVGGVVTFPRSNELRATVGRVPLDVLVVETDAPFLAPQSQRGKRNTPARVTDVVKTIAEARLMPAECLASATTENAIRLFGPLLSQAIDSGSGMT